MWNENHVIFDFPYVVFVVLALPEAKAHLVSIDEQVVSTSVLVLRDGVLGVIR
jgi:hypothetical protein